MSRAIMGSDLFEPVYGAEAKREEREAADQEEQGHVSSGVGLGVRFIEGGTITVHAR